MSALNNSEATVSMQGRDESFVRVVEQMRQYFSLADYLPVGVDATSAVSELMNRAHSRSVKSGS